ncbi:MAG: hypothetical protein FH749_04820 [Firmicutes bacterium]|nr:hypothetical protein [Bacillota bacterium]
MEVLCDLWQLQVVEINMVRMRKEWEQIKELLTREERNDLETIRNCIETAREQWQSAKKDYQKLVDDTESIVRQLEQQNTALYGDGSQSKELVAIQQKIQELEKRKSHLEEQQMTYIEKLDRLEQKIANETCRLQRLEEQSRSRTARLRQRQQEIKESYTSLKQQRENLREKIPAHMLVIYNDLVSKKKRPLSLLKLDSCAACGMVQSILTVNSVNKGGQYMRCSSCGRILIPESACNIPEGTGE